MLKLCISSSVNTFFFAVELEKELEFEQKAIENKEDGEPRPRESSLKSNAMFTKSRKKKVTSKRKALIQNKKKHLTSLLKHSITPFL